jgi:hypothetical protein
MLVPMTTTTPQKGFCFQCGTEVDGDILEHTSTHSPAAEKPKTAIKTRQQRLDDVVGAIKRVSEETDVTVQTEILDREVIMELYIVRASLTQSRRRAAETEE